ncbi:uncharacterized protein VICG_01493 [Vittaforma corneae ATCC 50505]|uniref:USP domain-containing protein n=1 Tax=Vittaforma corneae (strain ATCC 50505) TaxID=993615 RepID=L2GLJ2_VITCO|nr:uncharacterized protein VICG_01493 [Vittaforma corneae ATCC 50505]ELA41509.1 hypothetical protein VICG_01493 [Vittaforma corneae ATCC 50505]
MTNQIEESSIGFYVVTLHASKKNSSLLGPTGSLRMDARRNIDYDIVSSSVWETRKTEYDVEIPIKNAYNVYISFLCNGYTSKNVNVHGVEKVFDVIQTLFVCKAWSIDQFNRMYEIKWHSSTINPMMNFENFGDSSRQIILTVERKVDARDDNPQVLETSTINENELCSLSSHSGCPSGRCSGTSCENDISSMFMTNMKFYEEIYTLNDRSKERVSSLLQMMDCTDFENSSEVAILKSMKNQDCVGIINIGNSCYMNSSIQCLNSCSIFSNFFYCFRELFNPQDPQPPFNELGKNEKFAKNLHIISAWSDIVRMCRQSKPFSPRILKYEIASKNQAFNNSKEQDAAEFIESVLTYLHEGLCYKRKAEASTASDTQSSVLCSMPSSVSSSLSSLDTHSSTGPSSIDSCIGSLFSQKHEDIMDTEDPTSNLDTKDSQNLNGCFQELPKSSACANLNTDRNQYLNDDLASNEFERLINAERSIISELFYGMATTIMECRFCGYKKFKNDLIMFLPLSIPNKVSYHSSCTLILLGNSPPIKVLIPLSSSVQEAIEYTKIEHGITSSLIAVEYYDDCIVQVLPSLKSISNVKNNIFFYEVRPSHTHIICHLYYRKLYFIKRKVPIDFIVEEDHCRVNLYGKLKGYFVKNFSMMEFFSKVKMKKGAFNTILNMPSIDVVFDDVSEIFGDKLSLLTITPSKKKNDVSLKDCLEYCSKNDNVELKCEKCGVSREFILHSTITKQPKYLIIHLKRFSYLESGTKINTFIEFPEDNLKIEGSKYRLIATSNHIEIGLGYGHYVAYLRKDSGWYCCNDGVISKVPRPDKASSYILFYERID